MKCPSCNDVVPDDSQFCMNCGAIFQAKIPEVKLHNTNVPTDIADTSVWFEKGMEEIKIKGLFGGDTGKVVRDKVSRIMTFAFQIVDMNKNTTAYNGDVMIKAKVFQGYNSDNGINGTSWHYITNTSFEKRMTANIAEYYRAEQAKLWWKYTHPAPFTITVGYEVRGEVEVWFTPNGKQKLYKKGIIYLASSK